MSYKKPINKITDDELVDLEIHPYEGKYNSLTKGSVILGRLRDDKNLVKDFILKCNCGQYFSVKNRNMFYMNKYNNCEVNCGCVKERSLRDTMDNLLKEFNTKFKESESTPEYCSYCESYREKVNKHGVSTYYCDCCKILINNQIQIGETFEEIMNKWNPNVEGEDYKLLPVLKGNVKKGYKVIISTQVDGELYEDLKDVLWIKSSAGYVLTSMSKENLKRITKEHICYTNKTPQVQLHRVVLGIKDMSAKEVVGDHINGDLSDNRSCNLRKSSQEDNNLNCKKYKNRKYKYIGIFEDKRRGAHTRRWRASICVGGISKVKYFYTETDAAKGYDLLLRKYRPSNFNVYNFPEIGERGKDGDIRTE